jgi:phosphate transport system permease protein
MMTKGEQQQLSLKRLRWDWDRSIYYFCKGNATLAIVIVALIIIFLWREGIDFFPEYRKHLELYRVSGGELVDRALLPLKEGQELVNDWNDFYQAQKKLDRQEDDEDLMVLHEDWVRWGDVIYEARLKADPMVRHVMRVMQQAKVADDRARRKLVLKKVGKMAEAETIVVNVVDFASEEKTLRELLRNYQPVIDGVKKELEMIALSMQRGQPREKKSVKHQAQWNKFHKDVEKILKLCVTCPVEVEKTNLGSKVSLWEATWSFLLGRDWITQSFWMDWYGLLPILSGSLLVCGLALALAVPLAVGAAIYVNQFASRWERNLIKPSLEFIAAIPSVVLGFLGIAVLGEYLRDLSQWDLLAWVPGFPMMERLNVLTAACILAFMAVPTIFSLAEDAIENVPKAYKEGSLALGATKMQTVCRIVLPSAMSGITAAVLLGMGRVIGETMVVLLCAGNRISLPEWSSGFAVFTQPVHTMTGIIAQEMPEVVRGSLQYRALFVIGLVLFLVALGINFAAQRLFKRFQTMQGV